MFDALAPMIAPPGCVSLIAANVEVMPTVPVNVVEAPDPENVMSWKTSVGAVIVATPPMFTSPSVTVCVPLSALVAYCCSVVWIAVRIPSAAPAAVIASLSVATPVPGAVLPGPDVWPAWSVGLMTPPPCSSPSACPSSCTTTVRRSMCSPPAEG